MPSISIKKMEHYCEEVCLILKALSHPQRLLIMGHLVSGPKTVSELVEACEISQSQMSQFLTRMRIEGLVDAKKRGKYQYYSIKDKRLIHLLEVLQLEYCKG